MTVLDTPFIPLSKDQLDMIEKLGNEALANPQAVGLWAPMYKYISGLMSSNTITGYSKPQLFWFTEAAAVNSDDESSPAGFFIRDITRIGKSLSSNGDPAIQAASNSIGASVFRDILKNCPLRNE